MEISNKKDKVLKITLVSTLVLVAVILVYATVSYAFWQKEHELEKENLLSSGCFSFKLTDKDSINLADAYPMSESDAMKLTPYNFTIENNCSIDMHYSITLNTTGSSDLDSSIRYKLIDSDDNVIGTDIISNLSTYADYNNYTYTDDGGEFNIINSYILGSGSLKAAKMNDDNTKVVTAGESKTYNLYLWLDESVDAYETMEKAFEAKMLVVSKATTDASKNLLSSTVSLGDYIKMTPTSTSYEIDTSKTGYSGTEQAILNPSELDTWRVIKINTDGTIEMVSEYVSSTGIYFANKIGHQNFIGYLNEISKQYENSNYTIASRHMGYSNQTEYITDTSILDKTSVPQIENTSIDNVTPTTESQGLGDFQYQNDLDLVNTACNGLISSGVGTTTPTAYWLSSRYYVNAYNNVIWYFNGRAIDENGNLGGFSIFYFEYGSLKSNLNGKPIRPILTLKSNITSFSGKGTAEQPYILN